MMTGSDQEQRYDTGHNVNSNGSVNGQIPPEVSHPPSADRVMTHEVGRNWHHTQRPEEVEPYREEDFGPPPIKTRLYVRKVLSFP